MSKTREHLPRAFALVPKRLIGRVIGGKVEIRELLGEGSMGLVYRAHHRALGKTVAVKVLKETQGWDATSRERFSREARIAARFDHPNSVQILDFGEDGPDRLTYIVMEYIEGRSLLDELDRSGPMPPRRLARIMIQVLGALAAAHERGVIHRDVKSANIMITKRQNDDGEMVEIVKVCDFGIAKMLDNEGSGREFAPITHTGLFVGTPAYMAPEQAAADPIDERTDIYACGVVMYEMLSGRLPYEAENHIALIAKHMSEEPRPLSEVVYGVDARIETIVHWAIEKRVDLRCPNARELRRALKEFLGSVGEHQEMSSVRFSVPQLETVKDPLPPFHANAEDKTMPLPAVSTPPPKILDTDETPTPLIPLTALTDPADEPDTH